LARTSHYLKLWLRAEGAGGGEGLVKDSNDLLYYLEAEEAHDAAIFAGSN
jgi:hypothetical protein